MILSDLLECRMRIYEKLVKNEFDKDTFLAEKAKISEAKKRLERVQHELKMHVHRYQQFLRRQQTRNKEISLNEIIDCIDRITVSEGRQIKVTWADTD